MVLQELFVYSFPRGFAPEVLDLLLGDFVYTAFYDVALLLLVSEREHGLFGRIKGNLAEVALVVVIRPFANESKLPVSIGKTQDLAPGGS